MALALALASTCFAVGIDAPLREPQSSHSDKQNHLVALVPFARPLRLHLPRCTAVVVPPTRLPRRRLPRQSTVAQSSGSSGNTIKSLPALQPDENFLVRERARRRRRGRARACLGTRSGAGCSAQPSPRSALLNMFSDSGCFLSACMHGRQMHLQSRGIREGGQGGLASGWAARCRDSDLAKQRPHARHLRDLSWEGPGAFCCCWPCWCWCYKGQERRPAQSTEHSGRE